MPGRSASCGQRGRPMTSKHEIFEAPPPRPDPEAQLAHIAELSKGVPYFRPVGVEHDVRNVNDFEYAFIEIEFK